MSRLQFHNSFSFKHILFLWLALCLLPGISQATGSSHNKFDDWHNVKHLFGKHRDGKSGKQCRDRQDDKPCEVTMSVPLVIDNETQVGTVTVTYTQNQLAVKYQVNDGWLIKSTRLAVSDSYSGLPQDSYGNPLLKDFPFRTTHKTPVAAVNHMLSTSSWLPGTELYIAAHAEILATNTGKQKLSHSRARSWMQTNVLAQFFNRQRGKQQGSEHVHNRFCGHDKEHDSSMKSRSAWGQGYEFPGHITAYYFTFLLSDCDFGVDSTVQFEKPVYSASENDGNGIVTVVRSGDLSQPARVTIKSMNGSAEDGLDYIGIDQELVFNAGESLIEVPVALIDDGDDEDTETVNLMLSQPNGATIGEQGSTVLEIADNDEPLPQLDSVFFEPGSYSFRESAGLVQLTVKRSGSLSGEVTVDFLAIGGSATGNSDYILMPGTLVFADGVDTATINLTIREDRAVEGNETILIGLDFPFNAEIVAPAVAEVIIEDNEGGN